MSASAFSPAPLRNESLARPLLLWLAILFGLTAVVIFFFELPTVTDDDFIALVEKHNPTKLITHFAMSLIPTTLSFIFSICLALVNGAAFIQWMIQNDQGYLVFLIIGGTSSGICLLIYVLGLGGRFQEELLKQGSPVSGGFSVFSKVLISGGENDRTRC